MWRSLWVLPLVVAGATATARAEDGGIVWIAPAGCPDASEVAAQVVAHLGRPLAEAEVDARLVVVAEGRRWRVAMQVRTGGAEGERWLEAATCDELAAAAALILALTIEEAPADEIAAIDLGRPEREPAASDAETPPSALRRLYLDEPSREPPPPLEFDVRVRALGGGDLGSLPGASLGLGVGAEVGFAAWAVDAGVLWFGDERVMATRTQQQGADVGLTSVVVRGCYRGRRSRWRAGACLGGDAELTRSKGFGFDDDAPRSTTVGGGVHVGATWALRLAGPVAARADLSATWLVARTVLLQDGGEILHDPNTLVWRAFAGLEVGLR